MRTLTIQEQRTIRIGAAILVGYLLLFGGFRLWKVCEKKRADYQRLVLEAQQLQQQIQLYEDKAAALKKLMEEFHLDPARLSSTTAVAEASAAIQKAAASSGIQVGPVREALARSTGKELGSLQLEATGPVPAITALLGRLESLGFPLLIETVQLTPETTRPGQAKLSLSLVILDFAQWQKEEAPHA